MLGARRRTALCALVALRDMTAADIRRGKETLEDRIRQAELDLVAMMPEPVFYYSSREDLVEKCLVFILGSAGATSEEKTMNKKELIDRAYDLANDIAQRDGHGEWVDAKWGGTS
jgi:hypothetical protein